MNYTSHRNVQIVDGLRIRDFGFYKGHSPVLHLSQSTAEQKRTVFMIYDAKSGNWKRLKDTHQDGLFFLTTNPESRFIAISCLEGTSHRIEVIDLQGTTPTWHANLTTDQIPLKVTADGTVVTSQRGDQGVLPQLLEYSARKCCDVSTPAPHPSRGISGSFLLGTYLIADDARGRPYMAYVGDEFPYSSRGVSLRTLPMHVKDRRIVGAYRAGPYLGFNMGDRATGHIMPLFCDTQSGSYQWPAIAYNERSVVLSGMTFQNGRPQACAMIRDQPFREFGAPLIIHKVDHEIIPKVDHEAIVDVPVGLRTVEFLGMTPTGRVYLATKDGDGKDFLTLVIPHT